MSISDHVVTMGAITGAAGGVLREFLPGQRHFCFRENEPLYGDGWHHRVELYMILERARLTRCPPRDRYDHRSRNCFAAISGAGALPGFAGEVKI